MVPISETEIAARLFTYIAARGLERLHAFQLGVQRLEDRGGVEGGFGGFGGCDRRRRWTRRAVRTLEFAVAVEILASEVHVRGAVGSVHLWSVSQQHVCSVKTSQEARRSRKHFLDREAAEQSKYLAPQEQWTGPLQHILRFNHSGNSFR